MPAISSSQLPVTTAFKRNMTCQTTVSAGVSYISNRSHFGRRSWPFQRRAAYLSASCAANTSWSPWRPSMASARAATVEPFVCWKRSPSCWGRAMESRWQPVAAGGSRCASKRCMGLPWISIYKGISHWHVWLPKFFITTCGIYGSKDLKQAFEIIWIHTKPRQKIQEILPKKVLGSVGTVAFQVDLNDHILIDWNWSWYTVNNLHKSHKIKTP